jgi:Rrf2 family protein
MTRSTHPSRHSLPGVVVPAQLDYGIRGLVSLALSTDDYTKVDVIATDHGLSRKFLAQILVNLRNAGIVDTHRGSEGGYRLARLPEEITIIEVFAALSPTPEEPRHWVNGSRAASVTHDAWDQIGTAIGNALRALTVASFVSGTASLPETAPLPV